MRAWPRLGAGNCRNCISCRCSGRHRELLGAFWQRDVGKGSARAPSGLAERGPQRGSGKCLTNVSIPGTETSFGGQILHRLGQEMLVLRGFVKAAHTSATVC